MRAVAGLRTAVRWLVLFGVAIGALGAGAAAARDWTPLRYQLELRPDFEAKRIDGVLDINITVARGKLVHDIVLDAGALRIDAVEQGSDALAFTQEGTQLRLHASRPLASGAVPIRIRYHGSPTSGLRFDADIRQVATAFSTSQWMPCLDDPSVRAAFRLSLLLPKGMVSVGNGEALPREDAAEGLERHRWRLTMPQPSYLYGFAAGPFLQALQTVRKTRLQYFGPHPLSARTLQQVFADSADMLAFYEQRAGVPYPLPAYRQVLLAGPAAQEMAGFSVMGVRYGKRVLENPQAIWLGAHEMAHQWWGNGVTNRSWRHFWLNEGIATFMTAAYLEHRFGVREYADNIEAAREKYLEIKTAGLDRSLVFPNWDKPTATDRSLVYDKGALVVHELRNLLGDARFWKGLKHYTRKHWGQSVETADFQKAMEEGSGQDLSAFFKEWVEAR